MPVSRREFLLTTTGLLLSACAGTRVEFPLSAQRAEPVHYYIPAPKYFFGSSMDFSSLTFEKTILGIDPNIPPKVFSLLTVLRSDGKDVKRISVPGYIHSCLAEEDRLFLISVGTTPTLIVLDRHSLEFLAMKILPKGYYYGGHLIRIPNSPYYATAVNKFEMGTYGEIMIFDHDLKEIQRFSSHGFEGHEMVASPDGAKIFIGHYGSYIGSGPYKAVTNLSLNSSRKGEIKMESIHPANVSVLDIASGRLLERRTHNQNFQLGHLAIDAKEDVFLASVPSRLVQRDDANTHPAYRDGAHTKEFDSHFAPEFSKIGSGTTVVIDERYQHVYVPSQYSGTLVVAHYPSGEVKQSIDLNQFGKDVTTANGLCLLPDGKHFVVSTSNGIFAFVRETLKYVPELSIPLQLWVHSHFTFA